MSSYCKHTFTKQDQLMLPSFDVGTPNTLASPVVYANKSHWLLPAPEEGGVGKLSPTSFLSFNDVRWNPVGESDWIVKGGKELVHFSKCELADVCVLTGCTQDIAGRLQS